MVLPSNSPKEQSEATPIWPNLLAGAYATSCERGLESLRARELSLVMHLLLAALLLLPVASSIANRGNRKPIPTQIVFPGFRDQTTLQQGEGKKRGSGSGGDHEAEMARQGLPPRADLLQFAPPALIRNPQPKLPAEATVIGAPEIVVVPSDLWGDPFSNARINSQGSGDQSGFGPNCCGGVGPGKGRGVGPGDDGSGVGNSNIERPGRNRVGYPECAYCPTPSFSEEARKSKTQGAVTLRIVVGTDGRASNIRVVRGLGMGLDERAVEAVRGWRFKPAVGQSGKPEPTEVLIEVTFRLL